MLGNVPIGNHFPVILGWVPWFAWFAFIGFLLLIVLSCIMKKDDED